MELLITTSLGVILDAMNTAPLAGALLSVKLEPSMVKVS